LVSVGFNFLMGQAIGKNKSKRILALGIGANILLLGVFKYTGFVCQIVDDALGLSWPIPHIILPLAISFFTFQQIAFLVDIYGGVAGVPRFLHYSLFITFFPHLIAGPITHHGEMLPQFAEPRIFRPHVESLSLGFTVFVIGLFKKVIIADGVAHFSTPVFTAAGLGTLPTFFEAWGGAFAYAMQIYFDFSGYSDMAIGLGLLFGISLPLNFSSPYKAPGIIDFWRRWHMTLTRFLTAYVFNPLALAQTRRRMSAGKPVVNPKRTSFGAFVTILAIPTLLTMFISGVWHGAGWQFIIFGLLHGVFLTINHGWRLLKAHLKWRDAEPPSVRYAMSVLLTFLCSTVALVFFRSADVGSAGRMIAGMIGWNGIIVPTGIARLPYIDSLMQVVGVRADDLTLFWLRELPWLAILFWIVWFMPNVEQWMRHYRTSLGPALRKIWFDRGFLADTPVAVWHPSVACGCIVSMIGLYALLTTFSHAPSEFLYFQF